MNRVLTTASALFVATALCAPASVHAQESLPPDGAASLRDEIAAMKARIEQLEARLAAATPPKAESPTPAEPTVASWKGSPQFNSGDRSFKVKGRVQADVNYVSPPPGSDDRAFGYSSEVRRIRLGGEGSLGGDIGYKLELELSDNAVELVDAFVTYTDGGLQLAFGNQNQFQSLDELTGDTSGSFMERAAFTDAFNFERRLGLSAQYKHEALLVQGGIFADDVGALSNNNDGPAGGDENNSVAVDGRIVFAPKSGQTQLHFGVSAHQRWLNRLADDPVRYRQRPYLHSVNTRVIGTPALDARRETHGGIEVAMIHGPWHAAAEWHRLIADRTDLPGVGFSGAYAEVGYYLTAGDSRAYRNGQFGTASPKRPITAGGIGAIQANLRYDQIDLNDRDVRGGEQRSYLASLIWTPIDYLRLNLNVGYLEQTVLDTATASTRDFDLQVVGTRLELDF